MERFKKMKYKKGDIVYICGINIHKGGRVNLNKPPRKATVTTEFGSIKFDDGEHFNNYPGYEIFDSLEECETAYSKMKQDSVEYCKKQIDKFNNVIKLLEE